jgi:hypothetical protein
MKKHYSIIIIIVISILLLAGCDPIKHYSKDELLSDTANIKVYFKSYDTMSSYYFKTEMKSSIQNEIIINNSEGEFECYYKNKETQFYFKNDVLYSYNELTEALNKKSIKKSELDFLYETESTFLNISEMLDKKYILEIEGFSIIHTEPVGNKWIDYIFNHKELFKAGIFTVEYDEITAGVSIDIETNTLSYFSVEFIGNEDLKILFTRDGHCQIPDLEWIERFE